MDENERAKHKGNPFTDLIEEILKDLLNQHPNNGKLNQILEDLQIVKQAQEASAARDETIKADLLSIKAFFGIPDVRLGATQEQLEALSKRITDETAIVKESDANIPPGNAG